MVTRPTIPGRVQALGENIPEEEARQGAEKRIKKVFVEYGP